jgi:hypothetical protein
MSTEGGVVGDTSMGLGTGLSAAGGGLKLLDKFTKKKIDPKTGKPFEGIKGMSTAGKALGALGIASAGYGAYQAGAQGGVGAGMLSGVLGGGIYVRACWSSGRRRYWRHSGTYRRFKNH